MVEKRIRTSATTLYLQGENMGGGANHCHIQTSGSQMGTKHTFNSNLEVRSTEK